MKTLNTTLKVVIIFAVLMYMTINVRPLIKGLDARLLGYMLTDKYVQLRQTEDWSTAKQLRPNLDFGWAAPDQSGTVRIAHALGAWRSNRDRNTLKALRQSIAREFVLVEVDLALGSDGKLHCFHGAEGKNVRTPPALFNNNCTLDDIIGELKLSSFVVVLYLKIDFKLSAKTVAAHVPVSLRNRVVFQLYGPDDIATFNTLPVGFAGPIVTLYRTFRTVNHLDTELARIGARVVTVPISRVHEFSTWGARRERVLLTHPVENCAVMLTIRKHGFSGGYSESNLQCPIFH